LISAKPFDPALLLEKLEQSLENMVNGVMQAGKTLVQKHQVQIAKH
jgi:hypothetical protein